ncbi:uncharacterized protein LOC110094603, partial [Dendrobium catenatum]|uniref:uncharacterized protein LOC110094603 n=1 Tax=Dendrobium catenatum TaxID=906689 RepID=UPI0009F42A16
MGGLGFHASLNWQGPLRARLAWGILQDKESLLSRMVTAKYGDNLWEHLAGRNISSTWRILCDGAAALRPILRWEIGDGSRIDVLNDTWIKNRDLAHWPSFVDVAALEGQTVQWLLDENSGWRRDRLCEVFGDSLAQYISSIQLNEGGGTDRPALIHSPLSSTITAMAYKSCFQPVVYQFYWLRKFKLHPREHFFWWRVTLDAIPTRCWLHRRNLADDRECPWGCNVDESREHVTIQCGMLKTVFAIIAKWGFTLPDFQSWNDLVGGLHRLASDNPSLGRLYCYLIYQTWRARNDKIHGRPFCTPSVIAANALA